MSVKFVREEGLGPVVVDWWKSLDDDRGGRAGLRRATTVAAVAMSPCYQRLHRRLMKVDAQVGQIKTYHFDALATMAALLAHVKADDKRPLGKSMSSGGSANPEENAADASRPPVSPLRFMRLLDTRDTESLLTNLRRVLPLMGSQANVIAVANDVVNWGDDVKKRWAYDYDWPQ
jgi:CRISPR system Cascade subunit CasB